MNIKTAEKRIQHTPGPWRWNPGQPLIAADGFMVNGTSRSAVKSAVNRALIAGAPELLAACRALVAQDGDSIDQQTFFALRDMARSAVARAEGRSA